MPSIRQRDARPATIAAVVTGHTRGLGAAIAAELLSRGARVLGVARKRNATLAASYDDALREVQLDLSDAPALSRWLDDGALGDFLNDASQVVLVNNAGLLEPIGPLQTQEPADVARTVSVNVSAPLVLSAAFVQATVKSRDRRIMHVSSGAGSTAYAGWSVYCATKAALDHHARAVAIDRTPTLRIASVAPGVIDTDMQTEIRAASDTDFPDRERFVELKREGKLRDPADAATMLVNLLLSDDFGEKTVTDLRYSGGGR